MRYLRLIGLFIRAAVAQEMAYRSNFAINLLYTSLNLIISVLALDVLYSQVHDVQGWNYTSTLALLGVFLTVSALRAVCLGPSLESLAGIEGELWTGQLDFTLLRPVNVQFLASFRHWRPFALIDLALGLAVIARALAGAGGELTLERLAVFFLAITAGTVLLYALLLAFSALVFWNPGFLYTWVFDAIFQLARYPVGIYPAWLRVLLTWAIPVGLITTIPAEALTGRAGWAVVAPGLALALTALAVASMLFRLGIRKYSSASS